MSNVFEFGDALLPQGDGVDEPPAEVGPNQPYLNLATCVRGGPRSCVADIARRFRMVVLADEILEAFFETDLAASFRLESVPGIERPEAAAGLLGGLWSAVATEDNRRIFHRLTDELGKTIGKHQVVHTPSIGRFTTLAEPKARESLLTPAMRRTPSKAALAADASADALASAVTTPTKSAAAAAAAAPAAVPVPAVAPPSPGKPDMPLVQVANAALRERTAFAIDDAGDEDEYDEELSADQDGVMDEVSGGARCSRFLRDADSDAGGRVPGGARFGLERGGQGSAQRHDVLRWPRKHIAN
jgi:hypothetical protein